MSAFLYENFDKNKITFNELDELLASGWRHFGSHFFRYNLDIFEGEVCAVLPLRINLQKFAFSKSQRKNLQKNADLQTIIRPARISKAKLALFEHHKQKFTYRVPESLLSFISERPASIPCRTLELVVYKGKKLVAVSFFDETPHSLSSIYAMYDLNESTRSLGIFTMLIELEYSLKTGKSFYYQGYCYDVPSFYDYKKKFSGLEYYNWDNQWLPFDNNNPPSLRDIIIAKERELSKRLK